VPEIKMTNQVLKKGSAVQLTLDQALGRRSGQPLRRARGCSRGAGASTAAWPSTRCRAA